MNEEKWAWGKNENKDLNISNEEKEATKKAVDKYLKENPNLKKNIESQDIKVISNIKKEKLENEVRVLENQKIDLEKNIRILEKRMLDSYTEYQAQEIRNNIQKIIKKNEDTDKEIIKKIKQIKEIENYLRIKKQETRNILLGKEKEN